jgi:hypothetical protein
MNSPGVTSLLLVAGLCAGSLSAQQSTQEDAVPAIRYSLAASNDESATPPQSAINDQDPPKQYVGALDSTGLISMDHTRATHLLLGSTASIGWDTNPDNLSSSVSTGVYAISPYLGIQSSTPRTQLVIQYQPTITDYSSNSYSNQSIQVASFRVMSSVDQRWSIDAKAYASYGQDSVRFLAPQETVAVGNVPGTGSSSAAYLHDAGVGTNLEAAFGAHYKYSERDTVNVAVDDTFSHFGDLGGANSVATTTINYERGLSPRLALTTYGDGAYFYGTIHCTSLGGGVGIRWQFQENSFLSVSGGPQFDTSACKSQQGISFTASLGAKLTGRSQVYILAARQPTVSYLGGGLWQTSISAGYQRQVGVRGTVSLDVSHLNSDTLNSNGAYAGTYFDATYGRRLGHGIRTSLAYREYSGTSGSSPISRNALMFSVVWSPDAGHIFQ